MSPSNVRSYIHKLGTTLAEQGWHQRTYQTLEGKIPGGLNQKPGPRGGLLQGSIPTDCPVPSHQT